MRRPDTRRIAERAARRPTHVDELAAYLDGFIAATTLELSESELLAIAEHRAGELIVLDEAHAR